MDMSGFFVYASRGFRLSDHNNLAHKLEFFALKWAVVPTDINMYSQLQVICCSSYIKFYLVKANVDTYFLPRVPSRQEIVICNDAVKAILQGCPLHDSMTVLSQSQRVVDIS